MCGGGGESFGADQGRAVRTEGTGGFSQDGGVLGDEQFPSINDKGRESQLMQGDAHRDADCGRFSQPPPYQSPFGGHVEDEDLARKVVGHDAGPFEEIPFGFSSSRRGHATPGGQRAHEERPGSSIRECFRVTEDAFGERGERFIIGGQGVECRADVGQVPAFGDESGKAAASGELVEPGVIPEAAVVSASLGGGSDHGDGDLPDFRFGTSIAGRCSGDRRDGLGQVHAVCDGEVGIEVGECDADAGNIGVTVFAGDADQEAAFGFGRVADRDGAAAAFNAGAGAGQDPHPSWTVDGSVHGRSPDGTLRVSGEPSAAARVPSASYSSSSPFQTMRTDETVLSSAEWARS